MYFCFSLIEVVAIFDIRSIFIGCFSITLVVAIFDLGKCFGMDYRIIEFIVHLSFCKKRKFYGGDSEKNK